MTQKTTWEGTLFKKAVQVRDKPYIGDVVREAEKLIVVFPDSGMDDRRWDIPKKHIKEVSSNVVLDMDLGDLKKYELTRDSELPQSI